MGLDNIDLEPVLQRLLGKLKLLLKFLLIFRKFLVDLLFGLISAHMWLEASEDTAGTEFWAETAGPI